MSERSQSPDPSDGSRMIFGFMASAAIAVAAKLGIVKLVAELPKTVPELANATNARVLSLRRLLLFLVSLGIFFESRRLAMQINHNLRKGYELGVGFRL